RRCMLWNRRLVCADFAANGHVSAIDFTSGKPLWDFNVLTTRPDFAALTSRKTLFMARLAEMGSDRLAALFEGYPVQSGSPTLCRVYFLVVLNAGGGLVAATQVKDPLLELCNHPHPYGLASDTEGSLYIAFSGTQNDAAPLRPSSPTLLLSYTRDGAFK